MQQTLVPNESAVIFSGYWCVVGDPISESWLTFNIDSACVLTLPFLDVALFHETALLNASSILAKEHKITGVGIAPFSVVSKVSG